MLVIVAGMAPAGPGLLLFPGEYQRQDREYDENDEYDFCDPGRSGRNAPESQNGGNDGNNEKYGGVIQHIGHLFFIFRDPCNYRNFPAVISLFILLLLLIKKAQALPNA